MNKFQRPLSWLVVAFAAICLPVLHGQAIAQSSAVDTSDYPELRETLNRSLGGATQGQLSVDQIRPTPMDSLLEVILNSGEVLFTDPDGRYMITGDMLMTNPEGFVNLSAQTRQQQNAQRIAAVPEEELIVFAPDEPRSTITVFTDVDCTYCRRLHGDIEQIMANGIAVRYLAYPRGGQSAESYDKMVSVWCADDRQRAITRAKHGQNLPERDCEHPVQEHFELGNRLGITGTPAIVLPDGTLVPGYLDVDRLTSLVLDE